MACVHIIYEENGELKRTQFSYYNKHPKQSIKRYKESVESYFTRERKNLIIKETYMAEDTDAMIKLLEHKDGGKRWKQLEVL